MPSTTTQNRNVIRMLQDYDVNSYIEFTGTATLMTVKAIDQAGEELGTIISSSGDTAATETAVATTAAATTPLDNSDGNGSTIAEKLDSMQIKTPPAILGCKIYQKFGGFGWFHGTVSYLSYGLKYDDQQKPADNRPPEQMLYHVDYEDQDQNTLYWHEVRFWMEMYERKQNGEDVESQSPDGDDTRRIVLIDSTDLEDDYVPSPKRGSGRPRKKEKKRAAATTPSTPDRSKKTKKKKTTATAVTPEKSSTKTTTPKAPQPQFNADAWIDKNSPIDTWVEDMARWLATQPKMSNQNGRMILRQVLKLATGDGIGYPAGWPEKVVFLKDVDVDLSFNFDEMFELGRRYEAKFGKDRGNGWLLSHPIKKMKMFQEHKGLSPSKSFREHESFVNDLVDGSL